VLRNFFVLFGYLMFGGEEVFFFDDMVEYFDWYCVNMVGLVFDFDKFDWFNGYYICSIDEDDFVGWLVVWL